MKKHSVNWSRGGVVREKKTPIESFLAGTSLLSAKPKRLSSAAHAQRSRRTSSLGFFRDFTLFSSTLRPTISRFGKVKISFCTIRDNGPRTHTGTRIYILCRGHVQQGTRIRRARAKTFRTSSEQYEIFLKSFKNQTSTGPRLRDSVIGPIHTRVYVEIFINVS